MTITSNDIIDLAALIYGEARGEDWRGRLAVAHSVINRARASGRSIREVIYGEKQYSTFNPHDDDNDKAAAAARRNDKDWQEAVSVASSVLGGIAPDPTRGATHYEED